MDRTAAVPQVSCSPHSRRWMVVSLLVSGVVVNYIDRGNLSVAAVDVMQELGVNSGGMGVLLSSFFWTYAIFQIPCGYLLDRFGLRNTYAIAFLLWSLASASIGLAQSFEQILTLRLILGAGEAIVTPASLAYIRQNFSDRERGLPTAVFVGGMMLGPAIGTLVGGYLLEAIGWRSLFIWTGLVACVWIAPWLMFVREDRGVSASSTPSAISTPNWQLMKNGLFWCVSVGALFYSYFWYFCLNWLPSYFVIVRQLSPSQMATATAAPLAMMSMVSLASGAIADRLIRSGRNPLKVRTAFSAAGFCGGAFLILMPFTASTTQSFFVLAISLSSVGVAAANYWALTQAAVPVALIGRAIGYQNTLGNLGGISAPLISGLLIGSSGGFSSSIWIVATAILIAGLSYVTLLCQPTWLRPITLTKQEPT
jgi:ACS family D-galactonate transporter-like MFS transporter